MPSELDDPAFREAMFAWLRKRTQAVDGLTRVELSAFEFGGRPHRLVGTTTGIWASRGWTYTVHSSLSSASFSATSARLCVSGGLTAVD